MLFYIVVFFSQGHLEEEVGSNMRSSYNVEVGVFEEDVGSNMRWDPV